ncbi:MAG TPA: recombinase family protein [Anaerolineales bacterium]|nr:recombinase family protein [Anaerolineales bacterium]
MIEPTSSPKKNLLLPSSLEELEHFVKKTLGGATGLVEEERAIVYSRVSVIDPHARSYSMEYQPDRSEEYARAKGWRIVAQYEDPDRTGRNSRRPGLQALIRDVKAGRVSIVVVHRLDRLYRNLESLLRFLRFLKKHRVRLVSVTEQIDTDSWWGRLVLYVLGALAEMYVWQTSVRVREVKVEMARRGLHNGISPYGYCNGLCSTCTNRNGADYCSLFGQPDRPESRRGRIPVPHPVDQYAVKLIHALYSQGFSDKDIAEYLNTHRFFLPDGLQVKFRTKGQRNSRPERTFSRDSIREIVTNPFYAGLIARHTVKPLDMDDEQLPGITGAADRTRIAPRRNPNGSKRAIIELNPGQHQALISVTLWQSNQQIRARKFKTPVNQGNPTHEYLLTGIGHCWECHAWDGRKAGLRGATGSGDRTYYRCATLHDQYKVRQKRSPKEAAETLLAVGITTGPESLDSQLRERHKANLRSAVLEEQVNQLVENLVIPEEWYEGILAYYLSEDGMSEFEMQSYNMRQELARQRALFRQGHITQAEYEDAYLRINRHLQQFKPSVQPKAREVLPLLKDFPAMWRQMTIAEKRALLQTMFTGLYFDAAGQLRKVSANSPFDRLLGLVQEDSIPVELPQLAAMSDLTV